MDRDGDRREFRPGAARTDDPRTSKDAAQSVDAGGLEQLWLDTLREFSQPGDGLTAGEVVKLTGLPIQTISPRTAPLKRKNKIYDTGKRRKNPDTVESENGKTPRLATVWGLVTRKDQTEGGGDNVRRQ